MHRTQTATLVFAIVAALVVVVSGALSYEGLRLAFEREFAARVLKVAKIAASQVLPDDVADVRRLGAESGGFFALQAQLDMLCSVADFDDLALVDSSGATLYDVRLGDAGLLARSPYDSLAHAALRGALAGTESTVRLERPRGTTRVAMVPLPVHDGQRLAAVMVAEATPAWQPELSALWRRLAITALVSVAAIAVLAGILMRAAGRQLALERSLSRSENLAAMGRLTATLAHEIKNPLAIIRGSAKRLGKLEPEAQRMADSVVEEVDRLTRTVSRYLQFARVERHDGGGGDLAAAVQATLDLLEGEFRVRRCTVEREPGPDAARVTLDAESLKQVALNLVLNALEALPEGGRVRVAVASHGERAELRVADDGPGIPPEVLARLGEPFLTTKAQGTGLGLFLARRLVESAGGTLAAESTPGAGATVIVRLPLARG